MPTNLTIDEAEVLGVKASHVRMDNGEFRHRLMGLDGSGYIRTVMPGDDQGWQNAHYHGGRLLRQGEAPLTVGTIEMIIVQWGWVAAADLMPDGQRKLAICTPTQHWVSQPGIAHNIYMSAGAVTHCVKYGKDVGNPEKNGADWWPAPHSFDEWTKSLTEADIRRIASMS